MPDPEFLLLGDALWLDLVNTAAPPPEGRDALPDAAAYHRWTKAVQVEPAGRTSILAEVVVFRRHLVALAGALEAAKGPPPAAIDAVNQRLRGLEGREQLVRVGGSWRVCFLPGRPLTALEAVARSAAETLASPTVVVRRCANPECGLFFADDSPHLSRRWCSRSRCGQRGRIERRRSTRPAPLLAEG
jgi:predicted RNA-binding Zn ribbon-like protein